MKKKTALLGALVAMPYYSAQAVSILIDDFEGTGALSEFMSGSDILGGERELSGTFPRWSFTNGTFLRTGAGSGNSDATLTYDGVDGATAIDVDGNVSLLGAVSGTDRFWFVSEFLYPTEANVNAIITVHSTSGSSSSSAIDLDGSGVFSSEPLSDFAGSADPTDIGAIEINFVLNDGTDSAVLRLDRIVLGDSATVPEPSTGMVTLLGFGLCFLRRSR